jgi:hypothetical protein
MLRAKMYALFTEVNASEEHIPYARAKLTEEAAPAAKASGAFGAFWLAPQKGRGVAVVVFHSEAEARQAGRPYQVGQPPFPGAPDRVTVRTVEVREVLAAVLPGGVST